MISLHFTRKGGESPGKSPREIPPAPTNWTLPIQICSMASGYSKVSLKRLTKEYEKLIKDLPKGVNVYLPCETDIYSWEATIDGPEDSLYKGGKFTVRILASVEYPMKPPSVHFLEPYPYHINVSQKTGQVCLGLLGSDENKWDPTFTVEHILHAIIAILIRPEVSTSMDHETLNNFSHFRWDYDKYAKQSAKKSVKRSR